MVQTEAELPAVFQPLLHMPDVTLLHLSFQKQVPGALYLPNSTWTEGRNALLAAARALEHDFEYYVFCDDDLEFERGSFAAFNIQLGETRPAIGIPLYDFAPNRHDHLESHTVYAFDALMNAFHRDLVTDGVILPYHAGFDSKSWWFSQFFVIHLASVNYPDHVLRLGRTCVRSAQHRPYPRNTLADWAEAETFLFDQVYSDRAYLEARFRHHYHKAQEVPRSPSAPANSYRLTAEQLSKLNLEGPFWAANRETVR
jgi:hypothetical protein